MRDDTRAARTLLQHAFAADVLDALRDAPGVREVEYAPEAFAIDLSVAGAPPARWQLEGLFRQSLSDVPEQRRQRVLAALDAFRAHPSASDWESASRVIMPVIREASYLRSPECAAALTWELCAGLGMAFVIPGRGTFQYVTEELTAGWGRTTDDVFTTGLTRYAASAENLSLTDEDGTQTLVGVDAGDGNASALLTIPGFLDVLARELGGRVVAAIPVAPVLLVVRETSASALAALRTRAHAEYRAAARGISPSLFTSGPDGTFVEYAAPKLIAACRGTGINDRPADSIAVRSNRSRSSVATPSSSHTSRSALCSLDAIRPLAAATAPPSPPGARETPRRAP